MQRKLVHISCDLIGLKMAAVAHPTEVILKDNIKLDPRDSIKDLAQKTFCTVFNIPSEFGKIAITKLGSSEVVA